MIFLYNKKLFSSSKQFYMHKRREREEGKKKSCCFGSTFDGEEVEITKQNKKNLGLIR
jgi:hypothetical protein